jgi:hypothetical protein
MPSARRALAHRRAGGQDDQVLGLQPGGEPVEVVEAGGEAGDLRALLGELLDLLERVVEQVAELRVLAESVPVWATS